MFKSHRAVAANSRRGLEVLEDCARALLQELRLEGYAPGMDVEVQVDIQSRYNMPTIFWIFFVLCPLSTLVCLAL